MFVKINVENAIASLFRFIFFLFLPSDVFVFPLNVTNSLRSSHLQQSAEQAYLNNACHAGSYLHQR